MNRTHSLALAAVVLATHAPFANVMAQTTLQTCGTDTVATAATNWNSTVTLPKFDPSLGTLNSIALTLTANLHGTAKEESFDALPTVVSLRFEGAVSVQRPNATDLVVTRPVVDFLDSLSAFDGVGDYSGTSGITHSGIDAVQTTSVHFQAGAPEIALFSGTAGNPGTIVLPVLAQGTSIANGGGNLHTQFQQTASASVTVCYTYTPFVPPYFHVCAPTQLASVGVPISFEVCASAADPNDTVTLGVVGLPLGAHASATSSALGNSACDTFTWTPTTSQLGETLVTFVATDSNQRTTTCTTRIVAAECHMLFSFGAGSAQQVLFGRLYDTQLVGLRRSFPVSMENIPSFPYQYLPAHCYVQVVAYNPYSFPSNPSLWSQALHVIKDRVHQSVLDEYTGTMSGIGIRAEVYEVNGQRRVRFPFHVQGL